MLCKYDVYLVLSLSWPNKLHLKEIFSRIRKEGMVLDCAIWLNKQNLGFGAIT